MPIHVKVVSAADYTKWVDVKKKEAAAKQDDPTRSGPCPTSWRAASGSTPPTARPAPGQRQGRRAIKPLDGAAVVLDADHAKQIHVLLNGQNNGAMPSWKQLSDYRPRGRRDLHQEQLSNKTGQLVQPAEVLAQRGK